MRSLLTLTLVLLCGCATTIDDLKSQYEKVRDAQEKLEKVRDIVLTDEAKDLGIAEKPVVSDDLDASLIVWDSRDISAWPATFPLVAKISGASIDLDTRALDVWPNAAGDVNGNLWMVRNVGGTWHASQTDYTRQGGHGRHFPVNPPHPLDEDHDGQPEDYPTVRRGEECYVFVSGLCRDKRVNVQERTAITKVVW